MNSSPPMHSIMLSTVQETRQFGAKLAQCLRPGIVLGLTGALGAGKTELVRGIAEGLGISEQVMSPTFVLECVYDIPEPDNVRGIRQLCHWDLYRLGSGDFEGEIFDASGDYSKLTVVEWPEKVCEVFNLLDVRLIIEVENCALKASGEQQAGCEDRAQRFITVEFSKEGAFTAPIVHGQ